MVKSPNEDKSNSYKNVSSKKNLDYFAEIERQKKERRLWDLYVRIYLKPYMEDYFDTYDKSEVIRE